MGTEQSVALLCRWPAAANKAGAVRAHQNGGRGQNPQAVVGTT
jgi:hypothetical protein